MKQWGNMSELTDKSLIYKVELGNKNVPVRSGPSSNANIVGRLQEKDRVWVRADNGEYVCVEKTQDQHGNDTRFEGRWIHKAWLKQVYDGRV